jgi:predicted Holliday junction resolvase-like endonuclease
MMKKGLILGFVMFITMGSFAQTQSEIDMIQSAFGMQKDEIVNAYVQPTKENADAFMTLYNEYEVKRKEIGEKRIAVLQEYAEKWENITDEQADEIMKKVLAINIEYDKLIKSYYNKIKKVAGAKVATQFYQVETYILTYIRYKIYENIPFVGEK